MKNQKRAVESKTLYAMIIAIVYALVEQLNASALNTGSFDARDINWGMIITATLAIIMRFFSDTKIKL